MRAYRWSDVIITKTGKAPPTTMFAVGKYPLVTLTLPIVAFMGASLTRLAREESVPHDGYQ
jgi:hypothetical protein